MESSPSFDDAYDYAAYMAIKQYLILSKHNGNLRVGLLDVAHNLNLPLDRVNKLMQKLQTEGAVKEIE